MKKSVFLTIALMITMFSFGQKKEARPVSNFTGIDASSVFHITVTKGSVESLVIEADDAIMNEVRSEVRNGVLRLYLDKSLQNRTKNIKTLKAYVVMRELDKVSLSGVCSLSSDDLFTPQGFTGSCSGVSNMSIHLDTKRLSVGASGSSKMDIKALVLGDTKVDVSGNSKIQLDIQGATVKLSSSGASSIGIAGSATDVKIDISGNAGIKGNDFSAQKATISASGASSVTIGVLEALKASTSGASKVNYIGTPTKQISSSGASKVRSL
ncbi:MAG: DUF2807 domain-containing protein [Prevotellaceae bacterium]|jgi:hypothetical protein|nr:DUF2807 domain-containing protein [Prevotellaceae bacterium]